MSNNYCKTTVEPEIPEADMTPIELFFLCEMFGCDVEDDAAKSAKFYFYAEESICDSGEFEVAELRKAFTSTPVDSGRAWSFACNLLSELNPAEEYIEINHEDLNYSQIFQDIVKRSTTIKFIEVSGAFTCDKMRPGEFGGFAEFITADNITSVSTYEFLRREREKIANLEAAR